MNAELLKSFENIINFYKTEPKYSNIVGTELYEKMYNLEKQIFKFGGSEENSCGGFEIYDRDIYKCALCGNYFSNGKDHDHEFYFAEQAIDCKPYKKIRKLMFSDNDEYNRIMAFQKNHNCWNFCHECSEKYGYRCFEGWEYENNDSEKQVIKRKSDKILKEQKPKSKSDKISEKQKQEIVELSSDFSESDSFED